MATTEPIDGILATTEPINSVLSRYPEVTGNLISLLQEVQAHFGYLPKDALYYLAQKTGIPITASTVLPPSTIFQLEAQRPA